MTLYARLVAYRPDGDRLGVLSEPSSWSASLPVNDTSALQVAYPLLSAGASWLESACEVAVEVCTENSKWVEPANARYLRLERTTDQAKGDVQVPSYQMPGYASLMDGVTVLPQKLNKAQGDLYDKDGKRKFLSASVGQILQTVLTEARTLVTGLHPGLTLGFSPTKDSAGAAWSRRVTIYYEPGTSLLTVLSNLAAQGQCDWRMNARRLEVYNPDSQAKRTGVVLPPAQDLSEAPIRASLAGLLHTAILVGDEGNVWRVDNAAAPTPWGTSMKVLTQGGVRDETTARQMISQELDAGARERVEYTVQLPVQDGLIVPGVNVRPGDWVVGRNNTGTKVDLRVYAATLSFDAKGLKLALTLNDRFVDAQVRQAKRVKGIVNGASGDAGTGSNPSPTPAERAVPAKPQGLVCETGSYWDTDHQPKAWVKASWAPVTQDTKGLAINIDHYDLRVLDRTISVDSQLSTGTINALPVGAKSVGVWVRAVSADGVAGGWASATVDTTVPPERLDPPTRPVLACEYGMVTVTWDGKLQPAGGKPVAPPTHFDHVDVYEATSAGGAFTKVGSILGGVLVLDRQTIVGQTRVYRLVAVDALAQASDPSATASVVVKSKVSEQVAQAMEQVDHAAAEIDQEQKDIQAAQSKADQAAADAAENLKQVTDLAARQKATDASLDAAKSVLDATADAAEDAQDAADQARKVADAAWDQVLNAQGANLITNPGFETADQAGSGPAGWDLVAAKTEWSGTHHAGSRSLLIHQRAGTSYALYQLPGVPTSQGRSYYVEAYVSRGEAAEADASVEARFYARVFNSAGVIVEYAMPASVALKDLGVGWVKISGTFTVTHADAVSVQFGPGQNAPSEASIYWDDLLCVDVTQVMGVKAAADKAQAAADAARKQADTALEAARKAQTTADQATLDARDAHNATVKAQADAAAAQAAADAAWDQALSNTGGNLFINPGFETADQKGTGPAGWEFSSRDTWAKNTRRSGSHALIQHSTTGHSYALYQAPGVPTSRGRSYYVEAWVCRGGTETDRSKQARLYARTYDQSTPDGVGDVVTVAYIPIAHLTSTWQKISGTFTVEQPNARLVQFGPGANAPSDAYVYWDDLLCVDVTDAVAAQQVADQAAKDAQAAQAKADSAYSLAASKPDQKAIDAAAARAEQAAKTAAAADAKAKADQAKADAIAASATNAQSKADAAKAQAVAEASKDAAEKANQAYQDALKALQAARGEITAEIKASVNGKNSITRSTSAPGTRRGVVAGDLWWQVDADGRVYAQYNWDGTAWVASTIRNEMIASLDVNKLQVLSDARLNEAVVTKLVGDMAYFHTLSADRLTISPGNLFPDPGFQENTWQNIIHSQPVQSGRCLSIVTAEDGVQVGEYYHGANYRGLWVEAGASYRVTATIRRGNTNMDSELAFFIRYQAGDSWKLARGQFKITKNYAYHTAATTVVVPDDCDGPCTFGIFTNTHYAGTSFAVSDVTVTRKAGAVLIEDGAVTASKIYADSALFTKLATSDFATKIANIIQLNASKIVSGYLSADRIAANSIEGGKIKTASITATQLAANSVTASELAAGAVTAAKLHADALNFKTAKGLTLTSGTINSGTINSTTIKGGTITGTVFQTAASGRRLWISNADATGEIRAYDAKHQRMKIDGDGNITWWNSAGRYSAHIGTYTANDNGAFTIQGPSLNADNVHSSINMFTAPIEGKNSRGIQLDPGQDTLGGDRSLLELHGWGRFFLGGERGYLSLSNETGELSLSSRSHLIGLYNIPETTAAGKPVIMIRSATGKNSLYFQSSLRKDKTDIQDISVDPQLVLDLRVRDFFDRNEWNWWQEIRTGQVSDGNPLDAAHPPVRIPGLIAEEVRDAGLPMFCSWDHEGQISGVQYDRVPLLLIPIVKDLKARIDQLENQVKEISSGK